MRRTLGSGARWAIRFAIVLGLGLTTACDGGDPEGPGTSNLRPPPRLRIVQPAADADVPVWDARRGLGKVRLLFDLPGARLASPDRAGVTLLTTLEDTSDQGESVPTRIHDVTRAVVRKPAVGPALIRAWLLDAEGRVIHAPGSYAARRIYVGRGEDAPPPVARGPVLIWAAPHGPVRAGEAPALVDVLVAGRALDPDGCRLRLTLLPSGPVIESGERGPVPVGLGGLGADADLPVRVELIEKRGEGWAVIEGATIARSLRVAR